MKKESFFCRFVKDSWSKYWEICVSIFAIMFLVFLGVKFPLFFTIYLYIAAVAVIVCAWAYVMGIFLFESKESFFLLDCCERFKVDRNYENYKKLIKSILWWFVCVGVGSFAIFKFSKFFWINYNGVLSFFFDTPTFFLILTLVLTLSIVVYGWSEMKSFYQKLLLDWEYNLS